MSEGFGARIERLRKERNISKSEFARLVGVSPTCVWNWEEGNTEPRSENLERMARALGIHRGQLLGHATLEERSIDSDERAVSEASDKPAFQARSVSLADVIAAAKEQIAKIAGLPVDRVKVTLDY
ncbi:MAG: helix-turn-helix domain-containing protein [Sphingomonadales bacterium]|nr:helix-turn-helix domain-containing protein [Sphingomonadales bacterium]